MSDLAGNNPALRRAVAGDRAGLEALQQASYAPNRELLGVEPLPLLANYQDILATMECWLADGDGRLDGALILVPEADHVLIWSVSTAPHAQGSGLGRQLMAHAEKRAHEMGLKRLTLYTGEKLAHNLRWYQRLGYVVTSVESLEDRNIVHLEKPLGSA